MKHLNILLTLSFLTLAGCAKHRPVETLKDADGTKLAKSSFLADDADVAGKTWLSKVTVVRTSHNGTAPFFVGLQSEAKAGHFEFTKDKLRYLNDVSPFTNKPDSLSPEVVNEWEITHHDVKLEEKDGNVTNKEEEDDDKTWDKKRFFKIDFAKAEITEGSTFPYYADMMELACWNKRSSRVVDNSLDVGSEYISFVVAVDYQVNTLCTEDKRRGVRNNFTQTIEFRYSFKKLRENSYVPFVYSGDEDKNLHRYGFFVNYRENLSDKDGFFRNKIVMSRFNPAISHDVYFSKDFPNEYKWIYNDPKFGVMARTNAVFEKQGLPTRFNIRENTWGDGKTKELGDIRYAFVNIDPTIDEAAPLGYGPSDQNPFTGETIASTTTIWTGMLKYYLTRLEQTKKRETSKFATSSLYRRLKETIKEPDHTKWVKGFDYNSETGKAFHELLPQITFGNPRFAAFTQTASTNDESSLSLPEALFQFRGDGDSERVFQNQEALAALRKMRKVGEKSLKNLEREVSNPRNSTIYPLEPVMADGRKMLINGRTAKDAIDDLMYRTAIHEFGHNIGLRHNFYGSVDKLNFGPTSMTSSVMDYIDLADEPGLPRDWEPYDQAAIVFGYSDGKQDLKKADDYLYCSDEEASINALCNQFDRGTSPSEIAFSLIRNYEDKYYFNNYRNERAYWDTSTYDSKTFKTMWSMKKFLMMWRSALSTERVKRELDAKNRYKKTEIEEIAKGITAEMRQTVKLTASFYNAVLQQSTADRHYRSDYDEKSGLLKRIGIAPDKLWAIFFLMGDDTFAYDPNRPLTYSSYLEVAGDPELKGLFDDLVENALTVRVDMEPWFIGVGRGMYALHATNYVMQDNSRLIDKIRVIPYSKDDMKSHFGVTFENEKYTDRVVLQKSDVPEFRVGEEIGYTMINSRFYVASRSNNPVAFDVILEIQSSDRFGRSTVENRNDLLEMYNLYMAAVKDQRRN